MIRGFELAILDTAMIKHANRGLDFDVFAVMIKIVEIDNFFNAGLNDGLRAFDTREVMNVDPSVLEFTHVAAEVE